MSEGKKSFFKFNLKVVHKLTMLSLVIGLGSLAVIGYLSVVKSRQAMVVGQTEALKGVLTARQEQTESYFGFIQGQMFNFSQNRMITEATAKFAQSFAALPEQVVADTADGGVVYRSVQGYYTQEFKPRLEDAGGSWRGDSIYVPASSSARLAQWMYISDNPNAVGEKLNLDRANQVCDYNAFHATYHPRIRDFLESFGYYDIFLFDLEGNLVYSVFKETDYGTNFLNGPYKDTNFGDVYRKARGASAPGTVVIEDFKPYEPSYGAGASFTASPVFHEGKKVGVAVFQMPLDNINAIMGSGAGLGETGQTFLFGPDQLLRSNSRFSAEGETTILNQKIESEAAGQALSGQDVQTVETNYRGNEALAVYAPVAIDGLNWGVAAEAEMSEVLAPANALRSSIMMSAAVVGAIVGVIGLFFSRMLVRPLKPIVNRTREIANGDLTGDTLKVLSNDEFGDLTLAVNEMSESLKNLVNEVTDSAREVAGASTEIAASSEEMAQGISEQNQQVTQISAAVEEMSASIVEVARKSGEAANNAQASGKVASEGGEVVNDTINGMNQISEAVSASAESVSELGKRGEQIGQIIEVINDIADQTNLLALNAAIEAARAGEHGRGFAVVADEVRKLADRTTKATEEIGDSITAIQTETTQAVEKMTAGTNQVQVGVEKATQAGQSLEQIVTGAQEVAGMIQSIAAAAEEQSAAAEEVSRGVQQVSAVTTQSADGASQSAMAANQLSEKAEQLQTLVGKFKL